MKGGGYNYIVNPETGRKVKINGKVGKTVLKKYAQVGGYKACYINWQCGKDKKCLHGRKKVGFKIGFGNGICVSDDEDPLAFNNPFSSKSNSKSWLAKLFSW